LHLTSRQSSAAAKERTYKRRADNWQPGPYPPLPLARNR
jgi:hypothetical protein